MSEAISVADRILVLSARPAQVVAELPIRFAEKYHSALERRNAPEFSTYFNQVWKVLQETGE